MKINLNSLLPWYSPDNENSFIDIDEIGKFFGEGLYTLRKLKKVKLKDISNELQIPIKTIQRYETNENTPTITQAYKLASFYGYKIEDVIMFGYFDEDEREEVITRFDKFDNLD